MKGFMIQAGSPNGDGTGSTGNEIMGEFAENGINNELSHIRGVISMARRGNDYDSASSQFFIVHETTDNNLSSLDGKYAAFGYVVSGMSVVDDITDDVFPKTYLAEYYDNDSLYPGYTFTYHQVWAQYGNGAVMYDYDKPVIEYIKILDSVPEY
jgi:cyclophilin family peptidyl-prolyl cis-trans isomerase